MSKRELQSIADRVVDNLTRRGALPTGTARSIVEAGNTDGFFCSIAKTPDGIIDLWLDKYRSRGADELYYGFASNSLKATSAVKDLFCESEELLIVKAQDQVNRPGGIVELRPAKSSDSVGRYMAYLGKNASWFGRYAQANEVPQIVDEACAFFDEVLRPTLPPGIEGRLRKSLVNRYERDPALRTAAIRIHGCRCNICPMNFEEVYGEEIGNEFIHVHHLTTLSGGQGQQRYVDPHKDLLTVCPNCHAMLHRRDPPLSPAELREIIEKQRIKTGRHG